MKLLLTGATGKVGQAFLRRLLACGEFANWRVVAVCHNRRIETSDRVEVVDGSLANPAVIERAMAGATHVLHMAAVKESPDLAIDVSVKGMFLLLEAARQSETLEQFILIGGDCAVGHIHQDYPTPITETSPRRAYPGCYALTKVLEEVMLEQYQVQYGLNGCILRAPWIMEKDDFRFALSFGKDQFGGPAWSSLMPEDEAREHADRGRVPLMQDATGAPLKRNFIHVDDLVSVMLAALGNAAARQQLFNVAMDEPVDYGRVAHYLKRTRGFEPVDVPTPFFSNWLDNSKARHLLGWRPQVDFETLIERAWAYQRDPGDPRKIWYPG
jgi:nucleoside-diphosphate-sugar epimerase